MKVSIKWSHIYSKKKKKDNIHSGENDQFLKDLKIELDIILKFIDQNAKILNLKEKRLKKL